MLSFIKVNGGTGDDLHNRFTPAGSPNSTES